VLEAAVVCANDGYGGLQVAALLFRFAFRFVDLYNAMKTSPSRVNPEKYPPINIEISRSFSGELLSQQEGTHLDPF
jgi:hypothetical protein